MEDWMETLDYSRHAADIGLFAPTHCATLVAIAENVLLVFGSVE